MLGFLVLHFATIFILFFLKIMWVFVLVASLNYAHRHLFPHPFPAFNVTNNTHFHSGSPSTTAGRGGRSCSAPCRTEAETAASTVGAHQPRFLRSRHHLPSLHHHRHPHCVLHCVQTPGPQDRRQRRPAPHVLRR